MGCGGSSNQAKEATKSKKTTNQPKVPVRLFYLPGPAKDAFLKCISSKLTSNDAEDNLNVRFIDARIQRDGRRRWIQEFQETQNAACSLILADIRDHPTLLLTARCCNWIVKINTKTNTFRLLILYNSKDQLEEFQSLIPSIPEILPMNCNNPESLEELTAYIKSIERTYVEKKTNWTNTRL